MFDFRRVNLLKIERTQTTIQTSDWQRSTVLFVCVSHCPTRSCLFSRLKQEGSLKLMLNHVNQIPFKYVTFLITQPLTARTRQHPPRGRPLSLPRPQRRPDRRPDRGQLSVIRCPLPECSTGRRATRPDRRAGEPLHLTPHLLPLNTCMN